MVWFLGLDTWISTQTAPLWLGGTLALGPGRGLLLPLPALGQPFLSVPGFHVLSVQESGAGRAAAHCHLPPRCVRRGPRRSGQSRPCSFLFRLVPGPPQGLAGSSSGC